MHEVRAAHAAHAVQAAVATQAVQAVHAALSTRGAPDQEWPSGAG